MTNLEMIAELRKPGKVTVPVITKHDVERIVAEKADLINYLQACSANEECYWTIISVDGDGRRNLDVHS